MTRSHNVRPVSVPEEIMAAAPRAQSPIAGQMERRRKALRMSRAVLARRGPVFHCPR